MPGEANTKVSCFLVWKPGTSSPDPKITGWPSPLGWAASLTKQELSQVLVGAGVTESSLACSGFGLTQKQFDLESEEGISPWGICLAGSRSS